MARIQQVLSALSSHHGGALRPGRPEDDVLLELLVRMASSDGVFEDEELHMLQAAVPGWSEVQLRSFIGHTLATNLDLDRVAAACQTDESRWTALRFVARIAWRDAHFDDEEAALLARIADVFGIPHALDRVMREVASPLADRQDPVRLERLLQQIPWGSASFVPGPVASMDLAPLVPADATPITRIGVDHAEVMGIYAEGLVSRFLEGTAFLPWRAIVGCTHASGLESSVRIHTDDGRAWSVVDTRLAGVAWLIDRLHHADALPASSAPPIITRSTGSPKPAPMPETTTSPSLHTWDDADLEES